VSKRLAIKLADLAELALEGLPSTPQGLGALAARAGWRVAGKARGGAYLYEVDDDLAEAIGAARKARLAAKRALRAQSSEQDKRVGRPRGSDYFSQNPDIADIVRLIISDYKSPAAEVIRKIALQHPGYPLPHLRTMQNFIAKIEREESAALMLLRDPDAYNSKVRLSLGRADGGYTYAHQGWEVDTTPTDVKLIDEDGKPARFAILGVIDVWSRRCLFVLAKSESAQSVRMLIKRAISEWNAIPVRIRTDRGSGYINKTITSACELMGIDLKACQPGDPRAKGFIERMFGTFTRQMSPILPGFIGHTVAQVQKIRARNKKKTGSFEVEARLTVAEFQKILDDWVRGDYEMRIHGTTRQAPIVRAMQSPVAVRPAPGGQQLKIIMSASLGTKVVTKRGVIWKGQRYFDDALLPLIGQPVAVRYDEDDLGALFILDGAGNYICTAINYARADISEQDYVTQKRRAQSAWEKSVKAEQRRIAASFSIEDANAAILRNNAEMAGKLAYLRPLETSDAAVERPKAKFDSTGDETAFQPRRSSIAKLQPAALSPARIAERAASAEAIIAADDAGYVVDADALRRARAFVEGPAYAAFKASEGGSSAIIPFTRRRIS
jgi:putative transposase